MNSTELNGTSNTTILPDQHVSAVAHSFLSAKVLIVILILLIHTVTPQIFEKFHFHYLHESGISMILGLLVGLISWGISPTVYFLFILGIVC
jgi:hypothetical protein